MGTFETKFLKAQFVNKKGLEPVAERVSPFVAICNKPRRGGKTINEPAIFSGPQGFGATISAAKAITDQADRGASLYEEWVSTTGQYHGQAVLTALAVAAGKTEPEAYLKQITEVLSGSVRSFTAIMARKLLGPVGGNIGRIADLDEGGGAGEIQLTIAGDTMNFVNGMILQAAAADGSSASITARSGLGYVIAAYPKADVSGTSATGAHVFVATSEANRVAGTTGGPTGWADNDYLFRNGDIASSTDLSDKQVRSYQKWIPLTSASDSFNNVDRSVDSRYSGFRLTSSEVSSLSVLDRCQLLATEGADTCGANMAKLFVVGAKTWSQLAQEVQSYGMHSFQKNTKIGVNVITIMTCNGESQVMMDPHCLPSDIWLFTEEDLMLYNVDGIPALDDADGNEMLRQEDAATYAIRFHAFTNPTVNGSPWHHGRCASGN